MKKYITFLTVLILVLCSSMNVFAAGKVRSMPVADDTGFAYRGDDGNIYWFRTTVVGRDNNDNGYFANYSYATTYLYEDKDFIYLLCDKNDALEGDKKYSIYLTVSNNNNSADDGSQLNRNYYIDFETINDNYKGFKFEKGVNKYGYDWNSLYDLQSKCKDFASDPDCTLGFDEVQYLESIYNSTRTSDDFFKTHLLVKNHSVEEMGFNSFTSMKELVVVGIIIMASLFSTLLIRRVILHFIGR